MFSDFLEEEEEEEDEDDFSNLPYLTRASRPNLTLQFLEERFPPTTRDPRPLTFRGLAVLYPSSVPRAVVNPRFTGLGAPLSIQT